MEALNILRKQREDWSLIIVGDGPAKKIYEELSYDLNISNKVSFLGYKAKNEIAELMRNSDIFVLPSLWDNFPCALIEAIASGLPVISTSVGGIPEIVNDDIGYLVEPKNPQALSDAINKMLNSLDKFNKNFIAENAKRFSYETIGSMIHSIYKECLSIR